MRVWGALDFGYDFLKVVNTRNLTLLDKVWQHLLRAESGNRTSRPKIQGFEFAPKKADLRRNLPTSQQRSFRVPM
jgi:hypothetical protein